MKTLIALFHFSFPITIDRIEGDYAVVEWKDGSMGTIPSYLFPLDIHEGQSWYVHLQRKKHSIYPLDTGLIVNSYPTFLYQYNDIIQLPHPTVLPLGTHYKIYFSQIRGTYVQQSAWQKNNF